MLKTSLYVPFGLLYFPTFKHSQTWQRIVLFQVAMKVAPNDGIWKQGKNYGAGSWSWSWSWKTGMFVLVSYVFMVLLKCVHVKMEVYRWRHGKAWVGDEWYLLHACGKRASKRVTNERWETVNQNTTLKSQTPFLAIEREEGALDEHLKGEDGSENSRQQGKYKGRKRSNSKYSKDSI